MSEQNEEFSALALSPDLLQSREDDLRSGLEQLAALVMEALTLDDLLTEVAAAAVEAIPRADGVGVSLLRLDQPENRIQTLGASHPFVTEIDLVQYELVDEGPCISAAQQRQTIISASLSTDGRWPRFAARVTRLGIRSVLSLPMMLRNETVVGALNCYSRTETAFDEHAARLGVLFATPAAVAVHNSQVFERAKTQAAQLETALTSRATIDQAIGILRSRSGGTAEEGFERLRAISQNENVKLSVVAERLVNEAVRRARARHSQG